MERIGQGPIGRFAPVRELARERKGCESTRTDRHTAHALISTSAISGINATFDTTIQPYF